MIGSRLRDIAERAPDETAVVYGARRLTYAALNRRACRLANALSGAGIRKGDRVASLLYNGNEFVELFFATAKIGAVFVPINFRLAPPEVGRILASCAPRVLVTESAFGEVLAPLAGEGFFPPCLVEAGEAGLEDRLGRGVLAYDPWVEAALEDEPEVALAVHDDQLILASSGTTGEPKGAVWTHATTWFSSMAKIIDFGLDASDVTVVFGPLFHVGPLMDLAVPVLLCGGRLVVGPSRRFDPTELLETIEREAATVVTIYPTMWRRVLAASGLERFELASLRALFTGGEIMPVPLLHQIYARFPHAGFVNTYGSTEAGPITTFLAPEHQVNKVGSIGRPAFGVEMRIVDERGRVLGDGEVGEIAVRSPFVCKGYWGKPDATADALRGGWWHTGDLASKDADGFVWIAGRQKDMIISGTENIYPIEVEQVIASLAGVSEVAVVGVPDEHWGESVVAVVVCEAGVGLEAAQVIEHCRRHLASYKKPRQVLFRESLPRPGGSKVSKASLRAMVAAELGPSAGSHGEDA